MPALLSARPTRRRWPRVLLAALASLLVAALVVAALAWWRLDRNVSTVDLDALLGDQRTAPAPAPLTPSGPLSPSAAASAEPVRSDGRPLNVLLLGSDTRAGQGAGFGDVSGARSDTAMLVHLAADRTWAHVVSIPRDLVVPVPRNARACGDVGSGPVVTRFNAAFAYGGPACTVLTVQQLTGVTVDHVAVVDFRGFERIVDAIGGMSVCLRTPVDDEDAHLDVPAGRQTLHGAGALALFRARKTLADGSDLARADRQQYLAKQLIAQVRAKHLITDPVTAWKVADAATRALTTDAQLGSVTALLGLARQAQLVPDAGWTFATFPYAANPADRNTVVPRQQAAGELFADLAADRNPVPAVTPVPSGTSTPSGSRPARPSRPSRPAAVSELFC